MIKKLKRKIDTFLRINFRFDLPKKNKLLLFDVSHNLILKEIIKRDFNILHVRSKQIYIWIYLKQIIYFDFKFQTYCKNYINFTSPKIVITFNDARYQMFELKKSFKHLYFISVINGVRPEYWFQSRKKLWPKKLSCDYFFILNKFYMPKYKKLLNSKFVVHGHFRNNLVKIKKTKFPKQFLYLSQVHDSALTGIDYEELNHKKKSLNFVNLYLSISKKKLHILLRRSKTNPRQSFEIDFYKNIFKSNCVFHQSTNWKKKYEIIDKIENIIFTTSTMGYEALARKKKIACLGPQGFRGHNHYFGWPDKNSKKYNFFSTKETTYKEVSRVLNNINYCSQAEWNKKYYPIIKDQSYFDKNNEKLRKLITGLI